MRKAPSILLLTFWLLAGDMCAAPPPQFRLTPTSGVACTILTKAEIQQAIGTAVGDGMPQLASKNDSVCVFWKPNGPKAKIYVSRSKDKRDMSKLVEEAKKALPQATVREIPGLGEKALLVEEQKGATMVSVYRGGDVLVVSLYGVSDRAKAEAAVKKLAQKAFSRF